MKTRIAEQVLEEAIECALLTGGPDACPEEATLLSEPVGAYGTWLPGGYSKRSPAEYDRRLCLIPREVLDFVYATQPKEWAKLQGHYGAEVKERFLARLAREIETRGALDVLRRGIKDAGCRFELAYFRPSSGLNSDLQKLYEANLFTIIRQVKYSEKNENSLDLVLFLNGIPIFTAELKNTLNGQTVEHAIRQYRFDRDPREPLLAPRRCLGHFAVDPDLVYVASELSGPATRFLPFNQGKFGGAGNPPVPPTARGYATSYLWERVWARDSVLNLIQQFIQEVEEEDDNGRRTGRRFLIFPRYHQLDSVRRLVSHSRELGTGQRYLIEHSAGSGKSNSIAWLAHQLSVLHDDADRRVFDSIVIITDRRVLDRQLQRTLRQFEQTEGVVENIDKTSRQLKEALEAGKTIIVTTLQKFGVIADEMAELPGKRFAVIVDEAHSSQSGEGTKKLKTVLGEQATQGEGEDEDEEEGTDDEVQDRVLEEMRRRGPQKNVSYFAFTATPKPRTLELFGSKRSDGRFEPFSLYSMRQAIEEKFILDVLQNYTTYKVYWKLLKKAADDPHYEKEKASYLLRSFVDLHEIAIRQKIEIMVEHFHQNTAHRIGGRAKAMIVARSRQAAVRYRLALDKYLRERGYPYKALVAFSGTVRDGGADFTEPGMNGGIPEAQTAKTFAMPDYRFLVVANKFQTGFDQPLLHTMYVDKKLGGVNAVQTLSRLNRVFPGKEETAVLDFANDADEIQRAFEPYYEKTLLSESTDPNLLYDLERRLSDFHVYGKPDVDAFARVYFSPKSTQDQLYSALAPLVEKFSVLAEGEREGFRSGLSDYVRLYAFLSQILTFADADLEKLYVFARLLRRYLPGREGGLPREIQDKIDMDSYRIRKTSEGAIGLERGEREIDPQKAERPASGADELEALSRIIHELNERFGTDLTDADRVFIEELENRLAADSALNASIRANTRENARLTFDHVVTDRLQDMVDTNFEFYKRVTDDRDFAKFFLDWLFERFRERADKT
jgi:type I restriction enzyme R subunit